MKNVRKFLVSLMIIMTIFTLVIGFIGEYSYATTGLERSEGEEFENDNPPGGESVGKIRDVVVTIARVISAAIAIIMLMVLGMKYMTSAPGDRADIKKHAVVYVVGAFILFALPGIIDVLIDIGESFNE